MSVRGSELMCGFWYQLPESWSYHPVCRKKKKKSKSKEYVGDGGAAASGEASSSHAESHAEPREI